MVGSVEGIGVAEVEGEVKSALRVHLGSFDEIKPFGGLSVTFFCFWTECAGHGNNRPGFEELEFFVGVVKHPEFEFFAFFENPNKNGASQFESLFSQFIGKARGDTFEDIFFPEIASGVVFFAEGASVVHGCGGVEDMGAEVIKTANRDG